MSNPLQSRLKQLSTALAHIHPLVSRLRNFTTAVGQGDEARLELGAEIHAHLKETEEQLELLRVEVEALETGTDTRRKGQDTEKELERERVVALAGRLADDLKKTRGDFRTAQLQAKRNAELARRQERELLFSRSQNAADKRKESAEKLTQDQVTLNASNDVTSALRRTHQLMQAELSRSQFAQQTLEQSTAALSSLSESYTDLDSLISSSRNLIGSLLRSRKSDTWYLETAFYILIGTIVWLLFRRILYGPMWWLVWLPLRLVTQVVFGALGMASSSKGVGSPTEESAPAYQTPVVHQKVEPDVQTASGGEMWDTPPGEKRDEGRMIDEIGDMVEENAKGEAIVEDAHAHAHGTPAQEEPPRNTKKRMYEATEVVQDRKDEL
ncbi:Sec20-domain-containing protein [Aspergillus campestris IBT 28561]|uniref:Sec20-domain-containing protein n=1 Tax=Aspergillus campestris (strain IBT 28561) TaxID=1392248 RepID=A0A2I1DDT6_ASPC2|nr:Sec20-domain-containing protein [Aspergillus campestris IBT 28561]PKY08016.1 Sec20-domain-containing protein [Aspergillus campestris IBT 28561]